MGQNFDSVSLSVEIDTGNAALTDLGSKVEVIHALLGMVQKGLNRAYVQGRDDGDRIALIDENGSAVGHLNLEIDPMGEE